MPLGGGSLLVSKEIRIEIDAEAVAQPTALRAQLCRPCARHRTADTASRRGADGPQPRLGPG